jgi:curli biogenesis system outer membrane secretion channel CsgG
MRRLAAHLSTAGFCLFILSGCIGAGPPSAIPSVLTNEEITLPPPPERALTVGVYSCIDTTGQRRPTGAPQELSTAVPLDCSPYMIEAIQSLRPGYVFLVERQHVDELLRERQLATLALNTSTAAEPPGDAARADPSRPTMPAVPLHRLATLRVAEILLVGQVVAYDRATREIAGGASINGMGGDGTLVTDLITFSLRAVAVQTGQVLGQTTATKSVTSLRVAGHSTQIFSTTLLEFELGGAGNEAVGLALRAAVRSALGGLINQGIHDGWWS